MELKDLAAAILILVATLGVTALICFSRRAQEFAFCAAVAGTILTGRLDVNFLSHFWYRGTSRGIEFTFVDVLACSLLISTLLASHEGRARWHWPAGLGPMLLLLGYGLFSVTISEPKIFGVFELWKMARGLICFLAAAFFVRSERELRLLVLAVGCAVAWEGLLAVKQRYWDGLYRPAGSVDHANSLSMFLLLSAPVLVAAAASTMPRLVRYFCLACVLIAANTILLTLSRAGMPAFALVVLGATAACGSWRLTLKKIAVAGLLLVVGAGLLFKTWETLETRYGYSTLEDEYLDETYEGRGHYLRLAKCIVDDHFFGVGLNNWSYWVSKIYGTRLGFRYEDYDDLKYQPTKEMLPGFTHAAPAHNLGALIVGELGWPGLMIFLLIWARWFQVGASFLLRRSTEATHQLGIGLFFALCGVSLQSVTEWVYRQTPIFLAFHFLMGALAGLYALKRRRVARVTAPAVVPGNAALAGR